MHFTFSAIGKEIGKPLPGPVGPSGETIGKFDKSYDEIFFASSVIYVISLTCPWDLQDLKIQSQNRCLAEETLLYIFIRTFPKRMMLFHAILVCSRNVVPIKNFRDCCANLVLKHLKDFKIPILHRGYIVMVTAYVNS